jgi:hypothetical protein
MQLPQGFTTPPPAGLSYLITRANEKTDFTAQQDTDARTSLTRGLAEYLSQLEYEDAGGRALRFERVFDVWSEPEDEGVYPSAWVGSVGDGVYEDPRTTPSVPSDQRLTLPDGRYLVSACDYVIDLQIEMRCTDPEARKALCAMLERDLNPVDWRYGFVLVLPHYFNQRGVYELKGSGYQDSEGDAQQRMRKATFSLTARVPLTRLRAYPKAQPRVKVLTT